MGKQTPLYHCHLKANAKIVDFAGWDMPLHYGSQLKEHKAVREDAGVFDVSHMTIVDIQGEQSPAYLRKLIANNVDRLVIGKALYTCMLNEQGGVIDDLIVYKMQDDFYRLVVNSATHDKDLAWINKQAAPFHLQIKERTDLAIIAVQGPVALQKIAAIFSTENLTAIQTLKPFCALNIGTWFVARTGYTGEEGVEMVLPAEEAESTWQKLIDAEITPCGLGARDTLRLEAGLNLYGADMDETVTPLESNLTWTVAWEPHDRNFIGRQALEKQRELGIKKQLVGLLLETQGVLRNHQKVMAKNGLEGEITSGSFSPTLNQGIALARVPVEMDLSQCYVESRGKPVPVTVIKPPFVRHGKKTF